MTNAELVAEARAWAIGEHYHEFPGDVCTLLDLLADALEEADKGTRQSVDLVIKLCEEIDSLLATLATVAGLRGE